MYNEDRIIEIANNGKAWLTKKQQELPVIRERRLPTEPETELYKELAQAALVINALLFEGVGIKEKNKGADWLIRKGYQINSEDGKTYVEPNYSVDNDYVKFSQNNED